MGYTRQVSAAHRAICNRKGMENKGYQWVYSNKVWNYSYSPNGEKIESEPIKYQWSKEGISREEILKDWEMCRTSETRQSKVGKIIMNSTFLLFPPFRASV